MRSRRVSTATPPLPYPRPAHDSRSGRFYTPPPFAEWLDAVAWELKALEPVDGPAALRLWIDPAGADLELLPVDRLPDDHHRGGLRGDLDNYVKAYGDALQRSQRLNNDEQIIRIDARFGRRKETE